MRLSARLPPDEPAVSHDTVRHEEWMRRQAAGALESAPALRHAAAATTWAAVVSTSHPQEHSTRAQKWSLQLNKR